MANLVIQFHSMVLLILSPLAAALLIKPELRSNKTVAIFVFGDSVHDSGNNNFVVNADKSNFPPYGETFFMFPTGRVCDGRILVDFAAAYAGLPYWRPYLDPNNHNLTVGANFASAGAVVLTEPGSTAIPLQGQVDFFKEAESTLKSVLGEEDTNKLLKEAIYISGIGGGDYMNFLNVFSNNTETTESDMLFYVSDVVGNITNAIKEIYELGGRKFAFSSVAPLGCMPYIKQVYNSSECVEPMQTLATMHNSALNTLAEELAAELSGFKYLIYDYFHTLMDRIENPTKYGFKEGDIACCGYGTYRGVGCGSLTTTYELCSNPNEYVYFDGGHPSEACNIQLIEDLWNGSKNVTWPVNLRELIDLDIDDSSNVDDLLADE